MKLLHNEFMKTIFRFLILLSVCLFPHFAFSARSSGGGGSWYRAEGGIGLTGGFGKFDETVTSTLNENSLYEYSIVGFFRAGIRLDRISLGATGSLEVADGVLTTKSPLFTTNKTYSYSTFQGLGGGFLGITLWGDANGPELFGEYYAIAHRTVTDDKSEVGSPFKKNDALNGQGWGAGLSFTVDPQFRFGLLYRHLVFDKLNLSGTPDPVTRTDLEVQQVMLFICKRL